MGEFSRIFHLAMHGDAVAWIGPPRRGKKQQAKKRQTGAKRSVHGPIQGKSEVAQEIA
jgi:hypothetical protein